MKNKIKKLLFLILLLLPFITVYAKVGNIKINEGGKLTYDYNGDKENAYIKYVVLANNNMTFAEKTYSEVVTDDTGMDKIELSEIVKDLCPEEGTAVANFSCGGSTNTYIILFRIMEGDTEKDHFRAGFSSNQKTYTQKMSIQ